MQFELKQVQTEIVPFRVSCLTIPAARLCHISLLQSNVCFISYCLFFRAALKTQSSAVETRVTRREEELRSQREALQNRVAQLEVALHVERESHRKERESHRKEREAMQNKILQLEATIGELYTTIRGYQHSLGLRHVLQTHADRNARI